MHGMHPIQSMPMVAILNKKNELKFEDSFRTPFPTQQIINSPDALQPWQLPLHAIAVFTFQDPSEVPTCQYCVQISGFDRFHQVHLGGDSMKLAGTTQVVIQTLGQNEASAHLRKACWEFTIQGIDNKRSHNGRELHKQAHILVNESSILGKP